MEKNVKVPEGYSQVCVMPGVDMTGTSKEEFAEFFLEKMGVRVIYLEEIKTMPDMENGHNVQGTGGRNDVFFCVNGEDVGKFAVPRLSMGIKWIEDFIDNGGLTIHPLRIEEYRTW